LLPLFWSRFAAPRDIVDDDAPAGSNGGFYEVEAIPPA